MILLFISFILIALIFIPIPVKTRLSYNDGLCNFYIYKYKLKIDSKTVVNYIQKKDIKSKISKKKTLYTNMFKNASKLIEKLCANKLKAGLKLKIDLCFGHPDAACTAILFGLLNACIAPSLELLSFIFRLKKHNFKILPSFNKPVLKLEVNSIIFVSFANVIYMMFIIYKYLIKPSK